MVLVGAIFRLRFVLSLVFSGPHSSPEGGGNGPVSGQKKKVPPTKKKRVDPLKTNFLLRSYSIINCRVVWKISLFRFDFPSFTCCLFNCILGKGSARTSAVKV